MSKKEFVSLGLFDYQLLQEQDIPLKGRVLLYYRRFTGEVRKSTDWRPNKELAAILDCTESSLRGARSKLLRAGKLARFNVDDAKKGVLTPESDPNTHAAYMAVDAKPLTKEGKAYLSKRVGNPVCDVHERDALNAALTDRMSGKKSLPLIFIPCEEVVAEQGLPALWESTYKLSAEPGWNALYTHGSGKLWRDALGNLRMNPLYVDMNEQVALQTAVLSVSKELLRRGKPAPKNPVGYFLKLLQKDDIPMVNVAMVEEGMKKLIRSGSQTLADIFSGEDAKQ